MNQTSPFQLAVCAEMLWRDKPIEWRVARLKERGLGVGLWNWPAHNLARLENTGANFTTINGYLRGRLADSEGAAELLATARETVHACKRLGIQRYNLHGTGLDTHGNAVTPCEVTTGTMWLKAHDTLKRMVDLAEAEDVTFCLENLNLAVDHPGVPFASADDTLALVSMIDHPRLVMNLDLYHAQIGEGNLIETCRKSQPWIGEIQVADVPGRCEPGSGEVNFGGVARALKKMGYSGAVTMEAWARRDSDAAVNAFVETFSC
jgi:hydroxypyruvate isomerase